MKPEKNFIFFTRGKINTQLVPNEEYYFEVIDAEYSLVYNKVQIVYEVTVEETDKKGRLFEEFDPMSVEFEDAMKKAFYVIEGDDIKKVCVNQFIGCHFMAKITLDSAGAPQIDWSTVEPLESRISALGMDKAYEECIILEEI